MKAKVGLGRGVWGEPWIVRERGGPCWVCEEEADDDGDDVGIWTLIVAVVCWR